jgi:hypothetical protein
MKAAFIKKLKYAGVVAAIWFGVFIIGLAEIILFKHGSVIWFFLMIGSVGFFGWKIIVWFKRGLMFIGTGGKSF